MRNAVRHGVTLALFATSLCISAGVSGSERLDHLEFADRLNLAPVTYRALSTLDVASRKALYRKLPAPLQGQLWMTHFKEFLQSHPELTLTQRSVLYEAIGLITARQESDMLDGPISELRQRSLTAFSTADISIFGTLGPNVPVAATADTDAVLARLRSAYPSGVSLMIPECNCSASSNFCDTVTNPFPECENTGCSRSDVGCGWLWLQACNGICGGWI